MDSKMFEIRDVATFIPAIAIKPVAFNTTENFLLSCAGYGNDPEIQNRYVILIHLETNKANFDPYQWDNRTMKVAHQYIIEHFDELQSGEVIDVQYILRETTTKKISERLEQK